MADDILHAFLARLANWTPPAGETRDTLEREFRAQFGGSEFYVKKKQPPERLQAALGHRLAAGTGLADAFADLGVSRATGFRLLSCRWRCR
jgi:hypothetical protein